MVWSSYHAPQRPPSQQLTRENRSTDSDINTRQIDIDENFSNPVMGFALA
jgi:hypothetical protein